MRIIAGEFRSRPLKTLPGKNTRPTLDKVRESFFHKIGPYFDGGIALDLYGGSGAVALEALSRGISYAYIVDQSRPAIQVIKENVALLKVEERVKVLAMRDSQALNHFIQQGISFDFIYLDPPYDYPKLEQIITLIDQNQLLGEQGICLIETRKEWKLSGDLEFLEVYDVVIYGISKLSFLRRKS